MYKTIKYAININIQLENGIYEFEPDYAIGKHRELDLTNKSKYKRIEFLSDT